VLGNLENMARIRDRERSPMRIGVNTILTKQSLPQLDNTLDRLIDLGMDFWNINQLLVGFKDEGYLTQDNKLTDRRSEVGPILQGLKDRGGKAGIDVLYPVYFDPGRRPEDLFCTRCWRGFMLNIPRPDLPKEKWYGNAVVGCTEFKTCHYPYGNILDDGPEAIWNGAAIRRLRRSLIDDTDAECRDVCLLHRFG